MKVPGVSIIVPVWNGARYLAQSLNSLLDQTLTSFELIIIDDGSTDDSKAIAAEFAAADARIRLVQRPHLGIAEALNAGLALAQGDFIARMDSDDIAFPDRLARQVAYLDSHPGCVAVGSAVEVIDDDGMAIGRLAFPSRHFDIMTALIGRGPRSFAHPTVMIRQSAMNAVGGYRPEHAPSEDFDLWLRLSEHGTLANLEEALLQYRRHPGASGMLQSEQQRITTSRLRNAAREKLGLQRFPAHRPMQIRSSLARYHFECTRLALGSRNRVAALKHARAMVAAAPYCCQAYAALALSSLPAQLITLLLKQEARSRVGARASPALERLISPRQKWTAPPSQADTTP